MPDMLPPRWVWFALASLLSWVGAAGVGYHGWQNLRAGAPAPAPKTSVVISAPATTAATAEPSASPTQTPAPTPLPASVLIRTVPFTIQAPSGVWDRAHEEYCEAAAVYMVGQYFTGDRRVHLPAAEADAAMGRIVGWERSSYPGVLNLPLSDMVQVGAHFYNLQAQVVPVDLNVIEHSLAAGLPVILPVMTHPNGVKIYPTYGVDNVYHVLVLTGYDAAQGRFYTNDSGLREGTSLPYQWSVLANANSVMARTRVDQSGIPVPWQQGQVMLIFQSRAA